VTFDLAAAAIAFALIFPSEFPDKTFIASLVLATRFKHMWVWLGIVTAFAIQMAIAVLAGSLLSFLPQRVVLGGTFVLFVVGAVVLIKGGLTSRVVERAAEDDERQEIESKVAAAHATSPWRVLVTSFLVIFIAEWGDLSQLLTAGLAARTGSPVSVFVGSWIAVSAVCGIAVVVGSWVKGRVSIWRIRLVSGALLVALAVWTVVEFVTV
jgi:putative Ca2+/H+ antiporter (TMEM165/GDT1 family)